MRHAAAVPFVSDRQNREKSSAVSSVNVFFAGELYWEMTIIQKTAANCSALKEVNCGYHEDKRSEAFFRNHRSP